MKNGAFLARENPEFMRIARDLNYSDLILTGRIFSLCKDERTDFM